MVLTPSLDRGGPRRLDQTPGILQLRCCPPHTCTRTAKDRRPSQHLIISHTTSMSELGGSTPEREPSDCALEPEQLHSHAPRVSRYILPPTATPPSARGRVPSSWLPAPFAFGLPSFPPSISTSHLSLQCSAPRLPRPSLIPRASRVFSHKPRTTPLESARTVYPKCRNLHTQRGQPALKPSTTSSREIPKHR